MKSHERNSLDKDHKIKISIKYGYIEICFETLSLICLLHFYEVGWGRSRTHQLNLYVKEWIVSIGQCCIYYQMVSNRIITWKIINDWIIPK